MYEWTCKVGNKVREIWAICNVGIISADKTITWYDLWCAFIVETAHLFGCFEFSHQSWCPHLHFARKQKPFFVNPKHLKNLRRNRPNLFFHHHYVRFFFRIKRQTRTRPVKSPINILITNNLRACICLFNIYTTCTRVVTLYKFTQWAKRCTKTDFCAENVYMLCTCCVYVE